MVQSSDRPSWSDSGAACQQHGEQAHWDEKERFHASGSILILNQ